MHPSAFTNTKASPHPKGSDSRSALRFLRIFPGVPRAARVPKPQSASPVTIPLGKLRLREGEEKDLLRVTQQVRVRTGNPGPIVCQACVTRLFPYQLNPLPESMGLGITNPILQWRKWKGRGGTCPRAHTQLEGEGAGT